MTSRPFIQSVTVQYKSINLSVQCMDKILACDYTFEQLLKSWHGGYKVCTNNQLLLFAGYQGIALLPLRPCQTHLHLEWSSVLLAASLELPNFCYRSLLHYTVGPDFHCWFTNLKCFTQEKRMKWWMYELHILHLFFPLQNQSSSISFVLQNDSDPTFWLWIMFI